MINQLQAPVFFNTKHINYLELRKAKDKSKLIDAFKGLQLIFGLSPNQSGDVINYYWQSTATAPNKKPVTTQQINYIEQLKKLGMNQTRIKQLTRRKKNTWKNARAIAPNIIP